MIREFDTIVFQLFHDLLRASGQALNQTQIERLRQASHQFGEAFKAEAQLACLEYMKEFQANVKEAITELEAKIEPKKTTPEELQNTADIVPYMPVQGQIGNNVDLVKLEGMMWNNPTIVDKAEETLDKGK